MSRVFTEESVAAACAATAGYVGAFAKAIAQTRIAFDQIPSPGTSLVDLFLNLFDTSDPYLQEEWTLLQSWVAAERWSVLFGNSKLHLIPDQFKAAWPPPKTWAREKIRKGEFAPLPQNSARVYVTGYHRKRL